MDNIEKLPFVRYRLDDEDIKGTDIFTIRLNDIDRDMLNKAKLLLKQPKDSTALKQLAKLGSIVLHDEKTLLILDTILNNDRRNRRIGINDIDIK